MLIDNVIMFEISLVGAMRLLFIVFEIRKVVTTFEFYY